jgi:hypothetical protein
MCLKGMHIKMCLDEMFGKMNQLEMHLNICLCLNASTDVFVRIASKNESVRNASTDVFAKRANKACL